MKITKGTRVRVTYEGVVKSITPGTLSIMPDDFRQCAHLVYLPAGGSESRLKIEVIEPAFEVDAVYRMRENGCTYVRATNGWKRLVNGMLSGVSPDAEYRDCTFVKLVPEGGK